MKSRSVVRLRLVGFAFFAILLGGIFSASRAQNQCPQLSQAPFWIQVRAGSLLAQGATIECDTTNVYITMPTGLYFRISVPGNGPVSMFSFDPVTGHTTYWYVLGGDGNNPPTILIQDSIYGTVYATDGWYGIFYPIGNPYSASIQDPMQALMMGFNLPGIDSWLNDPNPNVRPQPIQGDPCPLC